MTNPLREPIDLTSLVSVGIPTYNRPEGLERTLRCITSQTHINLEIIVSDNGSPGNSTDRIVRRLMAGDDRIVYFKQDRNQGAWFNFRFVLQQATGVYFMWAADDDEWDPRFVETCLKNIGDQGSVMPSMGTLYRQTNRYEPVPLPVLARDCSPFENAKRFLGNMQPSMFYGLHHRDTILRVMQDDLFDFYDCAFILEQILYHGFVTLSERLYIAGIDAAVYQPKPFAPSSRRQYTYFPFWKRGISSIFSSPRLRLVEAVRLAYYMTDTVVQLFLAHEKRHQPWKVKILYDVFVITRMFPRILVVLKSRLGR